MNTHISEEHRKKAEELAQEMYRIFSDKSVGKLTRATDAAATALQEAADAAREWQPIETALKDGTRIIVYRPKTYGNPKTIGEDYWFNGNNGWCWARSNSGSQPTHWMPLPNPPHTPRTAQQSEAVIAKALGKHLTVVGGEE